MNFIVLSSSRGSTFQAVIDAMNRGELQAKCLGLVTDKPDRECISKAKAANIPFRVVQKIQAEDREEFDKRVHDAIKSLCQDSRLPDPSAQSLIIAEMGWMWIHKPWFVTQWKNRILNVHPALLPKHGGKGMYGKHVHQAVLDAHEAESGISIHIMDEDVDTGPILVQKSCSVLPDDTADSLQQRVQTLEKEWYPKVLQMIEEGTVQVG